MWMNMIFKTSYNEKYKYLIGIHSAVSWGIPNMCWTVFGQRHTSYSHLGRGIASDDWPVGKPVGRVLD